MKKIAFLLSCLLASGLAAASVQITPGNVLQPSCDLGRFPNLRDLGTITSPEGNLVKNRKISTGKSIAVGDMVFYVQLEKSNVTYVSEKAAEILNKSFFTPDQKLEANRKYPVWGFFSMPDGRKFTILTGVEGVTFPLVKEDGMLCSDEAYSRDGYQVQLAGFPQAYQELPFNKVEEPVNDGNTIAIAITLKELDSVSFTLDVAVLKNGKLVSRKSVGYDLMSSEANISGLIVGVEPGGKGLVKVKSINEPSDFSLWMKKVFNI